MLHVSEFKFAGKTYKAIPMHDQSDGITYECFGCAFDSESADAVPDGCINAPLCTSSARKDGRDIIWVAV